MTIKEALKILTQSGAEIYCKICTVDAIDEAARTVDVSPLDESAPILGVNLQANQTLKEGIVLFPVKGSYVVVSFLNPAAAVVVMFSEIDRIKVVTQSDIEIEAGGKITVKNGSYDLLSAFNDLFAAIAKLTVTTGVGQSGTPINAVEFEQVKQKINKLLK